MHFLIRTGIPALSLSTSQGQSTTELIWRTYVPIEILVTNVEHYENSSYCLGNFSYLANCHITGFKFGKFK